jgi:2-amino-4-hydroxy-6-hydroxymethyldihydropteridine diphosphokinase
MGKSSKRRDRPEKRLYAIGIGSNRPLSGRLPPRALIAAALKVLDSKPVKVKAVAPIITTRPLGPSARDFANSAAIVRTRLLPPELLRHLQKIERRFGRRRGQRWGARTLDLDILLWEGGAYHAAGLAIPHPALATRAFVLRSLNGIAPDWRDPASGLRITHLHARLLRPKPVDPARPSR